MGKKVNDNDNIQANILLKKELEKLKPSLLLNSYSSDEVEDWREDGFFIHFNQYTNKIEENIKNIGKKYGQAAIYKWYNKNEMLQETVPCSNNLSKVKYIGRVYLINVYE